MDSTRDLNCFVFSQYVYKAFVFSTWHAINFKLYVKIAWESVQGFICLFCLCFVFLETEWRKLALQHQW